MAINFTCIDSRVAITQRRRLKKWLTAVSIAENHTVGEITIALCSDDYIVGENVKFLSHNYPTDIITFDYCEGQIISGDLLISIETVASNAKEWKVSRERELDRVVVHGVLHLCGYGDKTEAEQKVMRSKEDFYLKLLDEI